MFSCTQIIIKRTPITIIYGNLPLITA